MGKFGCTICHQGQGSATSFDWASHTPDSLEQGEDWAKKYGWFNNHHWIFPMYPERFAESSCLKCHHQVTELESSPKFPDGPSRKLMQGYELIRRYGCFGCHEINGFDGPSKRIGPDLASRAELFCGRGTVAGRSWFEGACRRCRISAENLTQSPEDDAARRRLQELVAADVKRAAEVAKARLKDSSQAEQLPQPKLTAVAQMESLLRNVDTPGEFRKVA